MLKLRTLALVALLTLPAVGSAQQKPKPEITVATTGRYQLLAANYVVGNVTIDRVFLIDSDTGRTWVFTYEAGPDRDVVGWIPLQMLTELPK